MIKDRGIDALINGTSFRRNATPNILMLFQNASSAQYCRSVVCSLLSLVP